MTKSNADSIFRFWAKLPHDETNPNKFHPLICHMLDVAIVVREIWRLLPAVARKRIAKALCLTVEEAEIWIMFLAALHDLGKASPAFQLRDAAKHLVDAEFYKDMGKPPIGVKPSDIPHGRVTARELPDILKQELGLNKSLAVRLAKVIGAIMARFLQA